MDFVLRIRGFKRGANVICESFTQGGEGVCTLQVLNGGNMLKILI